MSDMLCKIQEFEFFVLASKVKFDFRGERSPMKKVLHITKEQHSKCFTIVCELYEFNFLFWPQRSNLILEVGGKSFVRYLQ